MKSHARRLEQVEDRISDLKDKTDIKEKAKELLHKRLKSCKRNMQEFKLVQRDKEGHFILIKVAIKETTIINLYAPNVNVPNFIKCTLKDIKSHIDPKKGVAEEFNTPL
jgi:hypothetical protein